MTAQTPGCGSNTNARKRHEENERLAAASGPEQGRCGARSPQIISDTPPTFCRLPDGHDGWHTGDDNSEWSPTTAAHPEDYCHRCHGPNFAWFTPGAIWDPVMRADGQWKWQEIICPICFVELAGGGTWTLLPTKDDGGPWTNADERAALIAQARAEGKAEADAAWAAKVEALLSTWAEDRRTYPTGADERARYAETTLRLCCDDLRALIPADSTALDQVRAQAKAEERERIAREIAAQDSCGVRDRGHDGCHVADSLRIARLADGGDER